MDLFTDELNQELDKIQKTLSSQGNLKEEDLKIILLGLLNEEDKNESKQ